MEAVYSVYSAISPSPSPAPIGGITDFSLASWLWVFSTGPALAGLCALGAAVFAFVRVGHQIAETRRGNNEMARKNREDQWWDTLKWTYTEAKESPSNAGTFQQVAAIEILNSLNQEPSKLTEVQKRAVTSILDIFGQSKKPEVQAAVAPIYQSLGRVSPREYEEAVSDMLGGLDLGEVMDLRGPEFKQILATVRWQSLGFDLLFASKTGLNNVAIQVISGDRPVFPNDAYRLGQAIFTQLHDLETSLLFLGPKHTAGLLISQSSQIHPLVDKALSVIPSGGAFVHWEPGMPTDGVKSVLTRLLNGQQP